MGPKLILAEYYSEVFYMEDRAIERLTDLDQFWMPYVEDTSFYPVNCCKRPGTLKPSTVPISLTASAPPFTSPPPSAG